MDLGTNDSKLIHVYLKGAKALEWNKYTLGEVGSRLWERLSGYSEQKECLEEQIKVLERTSADLDKRLKELNDKKALPQEEEEPRRGMEFSFMLRTYIVIAIIVAVITLLSGWAGEKTDISFLQIPFEVGTYFAERFGFFLGVVIHYLLIPLAVSVIVLLIIALVRRGRRDKEEPEETAEETAELPQPEETEEEKALREEIETQIKSTTEEIQKLRTEAEALQAQRSRTESDIEANDKALVQADEALKKLYEADLLPERYRGSSAVTIMEDWFETGRCSSLSGPDGALSLYDSSADSAAESRAVRHARSEADANVTYLIDSLSKESQLPRYYQYSEDLTQRILELVKQ
ncbi:MAG: hypothetical protein IKX89_04955 [Firmicutes bacterium]|nr:hypothetical protein [Bacillota bacterium]